MSVQESLHLSDNAPTTGVLEVYKIAEELFDKDKIILEIFSSQKDYQVKSACHGLSAY